MSFNTGLSGLRGAQSALDATSNNVANAGTVGFKSSQAQFADVFAASLNGVSGNQYGIGTNVAAVPQQFTQGNITITNSPLDIAINGAGFFVLGDPLTTGEQSYSRNGQFHLDNQRYIVNAEGLRLMPVDGAPTTDGIKIETSIGTPSATTTSTLACNLDSRADAVTSAFNISDPRTYTSSTSQVVYDSRGTAHTLTMYFSKTSADTWEMRTALDGSLNQDGTLVPPGPRVSSLVFGTDGLLSASETVPQSFQIPGAADLNFDLSMDAATMTSFGSSFAVTDMAQNGYTIGLFSGLTIAPDGEVQARYSNGETTSMGKIRLVTFKNNNGLVSLGGNRWAESPESGPPLAGEAKASGFGVLQSGAVEDSNVDLTAELVNMITQQRNYQANAQSIKTEDQLMQTLVNLR
jgi:flagellar hook protein FlgE